MVHTHTNELGEAVETVYSFEYGHDSYQLATVFFTSSETEGYIVALGTGVEYLISTYSGEKIPCQILAYFGPESEQFLSAEAALRYFAN